jgi:hypothetical protein
LYLGNLGSHLGILINLGLYLGNLGS